MRKPKLSLLVYVGSADYNVYALNANTGAKVWNYATDGIIISSPTIANGIVYIGSRDHNVYALDAATGKEVWSYTTGNLVDSSPTIANGIVYIGSRDHNVYALDGRQPEKKCGATRPKKMWYHRLRSPTEWST